MTVLPAGTAVAGRHRLRCLAGCGPKITWVAPAAPGGNEFRVLAT